MTDAGAPARAQRDPDGDDDPAETGEGTLPAEAHFERVGRAPLALRRICDLTVFAGALYAAHANDPLGTDGATITRYERADAGAPFRVAFDWNRPGQPTQGGGAGQGFLRVHRIGARLVVPDADPPYAGFGVADRATEGYVFVSNAEGAFARAVGPTFHPPKDAGVLPRAYHVIDAIAFRGHLYASTGSVPPGERAWSGPSPGALHMANDDLARWPFLLDYPFPYKRGVWRLTFLVRFRDRLYAGIQDYDGVEPNDYVVIAPPGGRDVPTREDVRAVKATPGGASLTLRWYADRGSLYWIAYERGLGVRLRVTSDGEAWRVVDVPAWAGAPTDVVRFRDALVVLTERRLFRLDDDGSLTPIALLDDKDRTFAFGDLFCAAPLAVYENELYAGGQRDGSLYRLAEGPPKSASAPPR